MNYWTEDGAELAVYLASLHRGYGSGIHFAIGDGRRDAAIGPSGCQTLAEIRDPRVPSAAEARCRAALEKIVLAAVACRLRQRFPDELEVSP